MSNNNDTIMRVRDVRKSYTMGRGRQEVLRGVDLQIQRGEFIAVMGASGSGKSTLLHIMGLLDEPDNGQVYFEGREVSKLSKARQNRIRNLEIGFMFQFYHLLPELNVQENVLLPMMVASSLWRWLASRNRARQRAQQMISAVGLEDQVKQMPATLSGGERQRAAMARALVQNPKLLLADEPTGNLDSDTGKAILELLMRLNKQGQTIIMVTHDANVAALAGRRLILRDGALADGPGQPK